MRKILLLLSFFLNCFLCSAQNDTSYVAGHAIKIRALTIDESTERILPLTIIEVFNGQQRLFITRSDFDGFFEYVFCSNKLIDDTLILKLTQADYFPTILKISMKSNTELSLKLTKDPEKKITKEAYEEYYNILVGNWCGTEEAEKLKSDNPLFRHCDGRIMRYRELVNSNEDKRLWFELANK